MSQSPFEPFESITSSVDNSAQQATTPPIPNRRQRPHRGLPGDPLPSPLALLTQRRMDGALVFAGQGVPCFDTLAELHQGSQKIRRWVLAAEEAAGQLLTEQPFRWSPHFTHGFMPSRWIREPIHRPSQTYLNSTAISQAVIFTTQVAQYLHLWDDGLSDVLGAGNLTYLTGHSQGMMTALLIAESPEGRIDPDRFVDYIRYFLFQGLHMANAFEGDLRGPDGEATPMAAIAGVDTQRLDEHLARFNHNRPASQHATTSLYNSRTRAVVSGPPAQLMALRQQLTTLGEQQMAAKKRGAFAGTPTSFSWEYLPVGGPFHSPHMEGGLAAMLTSVRDLGFSIAGANLRRTVLSPADAKPFNDVPDLTTEIVRTQFIRPVRWHQTIRALHQRSGCAIILDLGPGDGVAKLSRGALRGTGTRVVAVERPSEYKSLFEVGGLGAAQLDYASLKPALSHSPGFSPRLETAYTRATGNEAVILPGMTPTTADVSIVAAAANKGFTAELAGGGQVSEAIFWRRMEELQSALEPGREVVFNALFLDPYLWELHLGSRGLVQQARRAGYPICGVTISAGIPETDQAVELLDELHELGIWLNAFKPGTVTQVHKVLEIATRRPDRPLVMHLEGGKAGGHHSWESLDDLLLSTYHAVRAHPHVLLCVGGGIGDAQRAQALLTGAWSLAHGEGALPVDAILVGTAAMACREATASPAVKEALAEAAGTPEWILSGEARGDLTSGQSQLGADIHYLDNAASRCGRLLDEVSGDAAAVHQRRDEIIAALNATAKPYFGDFLSMSWSEILDRTVELMAVGTGGIYEDGPWPDVTFRLRVRDLFLRAESRLSDRPAATISRFEDASIFDAPQAALAAFKATYPQAATQVPEASDLHYFVDRICARPGKPVNFVPVINANVRRWYKADSLWQAQDPRYSAEQVLVIPGPEAVSGIRQADEPIAELLGRFARNTIEALRGESARPDRSAPLIAPPLPEGLHATREGTTLTLTVTRPLSDSRLLTAIAQSARGPLGALMLTPTLPVGRQQRPNPFVRLLRADIGARIIIHGDATLATTVIYIPADAEAQAEARLQGGRIALQVSPLSSGSGNAYVLPISYVEGPRRPRFTVEIADAEAALQHLYAIGATDNANTDLFTPATATATIPREQSDAYRRLTGSPTRGPLPLCAAFSAALPSIFAILGRRALAAGLLDLLHLKNAITLGPAWPPAPGQKLEVTAQLTSLADGRSGRNVTTHAQLHQGDQLAATVTSQFLIQGDFSHSPHALRRSEAVKRSLHLPDEAACQFLMDHPWLTLGDGITIQPGDTLTLRALLRSDVLQGGLASHHATGDLTRDGQRIGHIELNETPGAAHPVDALVDMLQHTNTKRITNPLTLASDNAQAPNELTPFAEVSGDHNPIHTSPLVARMAGLDTPIVHGMWTAARAFSSLAKAVGDESLIQSYDVQLLAPVPPGSQLRFVSQRVAIEDGDRWVEVLATHIHDEEDEAPTPVMKGMARVAPPPTAWLFPGQGIQQAGMGMATYASSAAAREVWNRADAFTRQALGFSVLHVVQENPRTLMIKDERYTHPDGLLNMTQFTQVAMAVLSQAQIAELKEQSVYHPGITCGHSVGEYNALSAVAQVLPLEDVVDIVYHRGLVMHHLVERDGDGQSPYAMGVIRPHYAGLSHEDAEDLVAAVAAQTGGFIEIVNYNIRGRQYSVTGHRAALQALGSALTQRMRPGAKTPYVEIPGIDVPFHSSLLLSGVPAFRETLDARLPQHIDPERLVGRYIPNLYPKPFSLSDGYAQAIATQTGSEPLAKALVNWGDKTEAQQARVLLIELLAYQFASPVRWIETQELLMAPEVDGGMGITRLIEVGVGYQPTLTNMASYTAKLMGLGDDALQLLNIEAHRGAVFAEEKNPPPPAPAPTKEPQGTPSAQAPQPAPQRTPPPPHSVGRGLEDRLFSHLEALLCLLAVQAKVRVEQINPAETIDSLFDGVSSRRNQVLMDLGAEFGVGAMDGAHERPIAELATELAAANPGYEAPGPYLSAVWDSALKACVGRAGMNRKDIQSLAAERLGLGAGLSIHLLSILTLESRSGASARQGPLGALADAAAADRAAAVSLIDQAGALLGKKLGVAIGPQSASTPDGGVVDRAAVDALAKQILGVDGILMGAARHLTESLGHHTPDAFADDGKAPLETRLALIEAEHGPGYEAWLTPRFDAQKHVVFDDHWATLTEDIGAIAAAALRGSLSDKDGAAQARRLRGFATQPRAREVARHYASVLLAQGLTQTANALREQALAAHDPSVIEALTRPGRKGKEIVVPDAAAHLNRLWSQRDGVAEASGLTEPLRARVHRALEAPMAFDGMTAVVTGAGPGSIALEVVQHLLAGGARVVVTTSSYSAERLATYANVYRRSASAGAELHVLPFNQASFQDVDALVSWLFDEVSERVGAAARRVKEPFHPDLLLPFAALGEQGPLNRIGARSLAATRVHLHGVERLITAIADGHLKRGSEARPCHVILPLSPNHGVFGGDGAYAETKAALTVLLNKWHSEAAAWAKATTLVGARIGWVRGTGLMESHDALAGLLETRTGVHTFSSAEMGLLIAALCTQESREAAKAGPINVDLTGGFAAINNVGEIVAELRASLETEARTAARLAELESEEARRLGLKTQAPVPLTPLPQWTPEPPLPSGPVSWPRGDLRPEDLIVVVGSGEIGPWGSARTRFEVETTGGLSDAGVLELAWMTGMIHFERAAGRSGWVDTHSGEAVEEGDIGPRYRDAVMAASGIRIIEGDGLGFDPERLPVYTTIYVDKPFTFEVASEAEGRAFVASDPERTRLSRTDDGWQITREAGSEIRVPKAVRASRRVIGAIPEGFDFGRFGISQDMIDRVDRLSLMNLVATVDAFISAGLTPEELLSRVHPARVGNTQGSGIGGMASLHRLYTDHLLGVERQNDTLQETLINVIAAYVVQSYVGSYGVMNHPVGACATAAVSVEEAADKLKLGKADFVIAGGFDDVGEEGLVGFSDMAATADTDELAAMGIDARRISRANDRRRRGFVEAQGGGSILLTRGDIARDLGLPVLGVIAYAGTFGDGIHASIPAPGMGALAAALGGQTSPLARALSDLGLTADDIAMVYKHDTSTQANDPNENALHQHIQKALGRTAGNPLWVVSQKTLTGHPKGGAAAWQLNGLCQSLAAGIIPGNHNLDCVDPAMRPYDHLAFTRQSLTFGPSALKAGLVTSLGFGHVSALILAAHPAAFWASLSDDERLEWERAARQRARQAAQRWGAVRIGEEPAFTKRRDRRLAADEGSAEQAEAEVSLLLNPQARLDPQTGRYAPGGAAR